MPPRNGSAPLSQLGFASSCDPFRRSRCENVAASWVRDRDPQLPVHLGEVILNRGVAHEQLAGYVLIGVASGGELGDSQLLGREIQTCFNRSFSCSLSGRLQF